MCLIVNEKANSTALISLIVYTACALCYMCIYTCLCKDVLACLKIPPCWNNMPDKRVFSIWEGQKSESVSFCTVYYKFSRIIGNLAKPDVYRFMFLKPHPRVIRSSDGGWHGQNHFFPLQHIVAQNQDVAKEWDTIRLNIILTHPKSNVT